MKNRKTTKTSSHKYKTDGHIDWNSLTIWLTRWLSDSLTQWLADSLTSWLSDWLADSVTRWLTDWLIDWLTGWLTDWLNDLMTALYSLSSVTNLLSNFADKSQSGGDFILPQLYANCWENVNSINEGQKP